jgi:ATP-dependent DNA ligase
MGLEGIVSKRTDAPYRSGPSKTWVKSKNPASEAVHRKREEEWHSPAFTVRGHRGGTKKKAAVLQSWLATANSRAYISLYVPI